MCQSGESTDTTTEISRIPQRISIFNPVAKDGEKLRWLNLIIMENQELFICKCESLEHLAAFYYSEDDNELSIQIHLKPETNKWKRVWCAVKYAFGYRSKNGDFDEFILKVSDVERLRVILEKMKYFKDE